MFDVRRAHEVSIGYVELRRPSALRRAELRAHCFACRCDRCEATESREGEASGSREGDSGSREGEASDSRERDIEGNIEGDSRCARWRLEERLLEGLACPLGPAPKASARGARASAGAARLASALHDAEAKAEAWQTLLSTGELSEGAAQALGVPLRCTGVGIVSTNSSHSAGGEPRSSHGVTHGSGSPKSDQVAASAGAVMTCSACGRRGDAASSAAALTLADELGRRAGLEAERDSTQEDEHLLEKASAIYSRCLHARHWRRRRCDEKLLQLRLAREVLKALLLFIQFFL